MKQLLIFVFIILSIQISNAQVWVEIGVKGGYGMSLLLNKNLFDDSSYNHQFTGANGFGGRVGLNFGDNRNGGNSHGLSFDIMSHRMSQNFEYTLASNPGFHENTVNWKNLDLYFLYRYSNNRVYLELGPMLSLVRSIENDDDLLNLVEVNVEDYYRDKYYSAVFGFGGYLVGTDAFSLNFGARIHYAMQDFITEEGQNPDPLGIIKSFPAPVRDETYADYKATKPLFVEFSLELSFGLGAMARTSCGGRMHWFWSGNR